MPESRVRHPSIDVRQCRERRVHQDDARYDTRIEVIIDLGGVESRDLNLGEQLLEQCGAGLGQLVQCQGAAGELGKNGEQAGPRGGLQNPIGRRDAGRGACGEPKRDRRRELLKGLTVLGAPRVGRQTARDSREHQQHRGRRAGLDTNCGTKLAKEQNSCRLADIIGGFPVPDASGVGSAEGSFHGATQDSGIDATAALEINHELSRGPDGGGGETCSGAHRERRGGSAAGERFGHERVSFGEQERIEPSGALL
ncbi:hypothetical protein ACVWW4_000201 [Bradyrhizobium sp. LB7.1]